MIERPENGKLLMSHGRRYRRGEFRGPLTVSNSGQIDEVLDRVRFGYIPDGMERREHVVKEGLHAALCSSESLPDPAPRASMRSERNFGSEIPLVRSRWPFDELHPGQAKREQLHFGDSTRRRMQTWRG